MEAFRFETTKPKNAETRSERPRERPVKDKSPRPDGKFELTTDEKKVNNCPPINSERFSEA